MSDRNISPVTLIIGGTGVLGQALIDTLAASGNNIVF